MSQFVNNEVWNHLKKKFITHAQVMKYLVKRQAAIGPGKKHTVTYTLARGSCSTFLLIFCVS